MSRSAIADFFDISSPFDLPPEKAIQHFKTKGLRPTFAWQDMLGDEHRAAFTVAKMMDVDLLSDVHKSLEQALAAGTNYRDWADQLMPLLQSRGWWGRKAMIDPLTGKAVIAELGSPGRLQTIFRTNMQSAYAAGHWEQMEAQAEDAPYVMYDAVDDWRVRPEHKAWDGTVVPITSKWLRSHNPPCGWNCRCSLIQLDVDDLENMGLTPKEPRTKFYNWENPRTGKTYKIPEGVDPGFGGAAADRIDRLQTLLTEKIAALPAPAQKAARRSAKAEPVSDPVQRAEESAAAYVVERGVRAGQNIEYAAVFDEVTGTEILRKRGGKSHVSFSATEQGSIKRAGRAVMYHNHPAGMSLSTADLVFASNQGLIRVVAVSNDGAGQFHASEFGAAQAIRQAAKDADKFLTHRIGVMFSRNELAIEEANQLYFHMINTLVASLGLIKYEARAMPEILRIAMTKTEQQRDRWVDDFKRQYR